MPRIKVRAHAISSWQADNAKVPIGPDEAGLVGAKDLERRNGATTDIWLGERSNPSKVRCE
jgi:hypothetical protein